MELSSSQRETSTPHNNGFHHRNTHPAPPSPKPITRTEPNSPYPTTFVQADTSSFKQVVQMLTGSSSSSSSETNSKHPSSSSKPHHTIPPMKSSPMKQQAGGGFRLYERRNSLKNNLKINPLNSNTNSGFSSPRKTEMLSPSVLDFPALMISPVTPLLQDPFGRSCAASPMSPPLDRQAEEKAIMEKGFFFHPSPATTPRDGESPRLLPLFPTTSPRGGRSDCCSSCSDS